MLVSVRLRISWGSDTPIPLPQGSFGVVVLFQPHFQGHFVKLPSRSP